MSDSPLFQLVLVLKVYRCPSNVSSVNFRTLICCTCYFQSSSPFFVYFGFLCLLVSSVSNFHPDTRGQRWSLIWTHLSSCIVGREGLCTQISLMCGECSQCMDCIGFAPLMAHVLSQCTLLRLQVALAVQSGPWVSCTSQV